jgi:hypothetical protein
MVLKTLHECYIILNSFAALKSAFLALIFIATLCKSSFA